MLTGLPKTAVPLSSIEAEWVLEQPWLAKRHRQALGYAVAPGLADGGPPPYACWFVGTINYGYTNIHVCIYIYICRSRHRYRYLTMDIQRISAP